MAGPVSALDFESKASEKYSREFTQDSTGSFIFDFLYTFQAYLDDLTTDEVRQVKENRKEIITEKAKQFKTGEEYLKSLDDDQ